MIDRLDLTSSDWVLVQNRGKLFTFEKAPDNINPRSLVNQEVIIDGDLYLVLSVETFAIPDPYPSHLSFGLLVRRVNA